MLLKIACLLLKIAVLLLKIAGLLLKIAGLLLKIAGLLLKIDAVPDSSPKVDIVTNGGGDVRCGHGPGGL